MFFDEQFNVVKTGYSRVGNANAVKDHFSELQKLPVQKNGYLYVYVSNESPVAVFFDNLQVVHTRGPVLEESHYYPFGLIMAGISSKAASFGGAENKTKFQGQEFANKEFSDGSGLDMYEFKYRMDDPQTGRFWQIDPLADKYVYNSTYAFSENHVTSHVELEGLEKFSIQELWRSAGITSSTDPKQFVKDAGKEALKPSTWIEGTVGAGKIAVPMVLTGIMTGGFGEGAVFTAETNALRTSWVEAPEVDLAARATEIHSTLEPFTQRMNTTAVASATTAEGNGVTLVASNEIKLRPAQRAALQPGEVAVTGKGHAETTILNYASANGMQVNAVAASRPICANCATAINNAGAVPASPLKTLSIKVPSDQLYIKPPIITQPK